MLTLFGRLNQAKLRTPTVACIPGPRVQFRKGLLEKACMPGPRVQPVCPRVQPVCPRVQLVCGSNLLYFFASSFSLPIAIETANIKLVWHCTALHNYLHHHVSIIKTLQSLFTSGICCYVGRCVQTGLWLRPGRYGGAPWAGWTDTLPFDPNLFRNLFLKSFLNDQKQAVNLRGSQ